MNERIIADWELLAYLDGEVDEVLRLLIEQDVSCQARLGVLSGREQRLRHQLATIPKPTLLQLAEYDLGLTPAGTIPTPTYLAEHPHAKHQRQQWQAFLTHLEPPVITLSPYQVLIAELLRPLAFGGLRGETEQLYRAEGIEIALEQSPHPTYFSAQLVAGIITGLLSGRVQLWANEQLMAETELDELGQFVLEPIPAGQYALTISNNDKTIFIPALTIMD